MSANPDLRRFARADSTYVHVLRSRWRRDTWCGRRVRHDAPAAYARDPAATCPLCIREMAGAAEAWLRISALPPAGRPT